VCGKTFNSILKATGFDDFECSNWYFKASCLFRKLKNQHNRTSIKLLILSYIHIQLVYTQSTAAHNPSPEKGKKNSEKHELSS